MSGKVSLKGIAHITGGAYYEKLTKILPPGACFVVDRKSWSVPEIFSRVQDKGRVPREDMYRTFNMGIGMVLVVRPQDALPVKKFLARRRLKTYVIGEVTKDAKRKLRFLN